MHQEHLHGSGETAWLTQHPACDLADRAQRHRRCQRHQRAAHHPSRLSYSRPSRNAPHTNAHAHSRQRRHHAHRHSSRSELVRSWCEHELSRASAHQACAICTASMARCRHAIVRRWQQRRSRNQAQRARRSLVARRAAAHAHPHASDLQIQLDSIAGTVHAENHAVEGDRNGRVERHIRGAAGWTRAADVVAQHVALTP
mmetsp:Transcript_20478/g.65578  ORF Transcript_20478/g.65578 Transcript_20478/m.65578 type:complete len:200 (+) Transcript_20478:1171-1770(+)